MRYFLPYSLVAIPVAGLLLGGAWIYAAAPPVFLLVILAEWALGEAGPPRNAPVSRWINSLPVWLWPR